MNVFIIWSGKTSQAIAEALRDWLPQVIQAVKPWMSAKDIDKGSHWIIELSKQLADVNFGIVCLTPNNLNEPWILFESGATSKEVGKARVSPYLFELKTTDVTGPLAQFQMTLSDKKETFQLIQSINSALGDQGLKEDILQQSFDKWWPEFEKKLDKIKTDAKEEHTEIEPKRTQDDKLDEILNVVRQFSRKPPTIFGWETEHYPGAKMIQPEAFKDRYIYEYTGEEPDFVVMTPSGLKGFRSGLPVEITEVKEESDKKKKK